MLLAAGVRSVLLKGRAFATLLYADGAPRRYGDLDLLIPPSDRERAQAVLREIGFTPVETFAPSDLPRDSAAGRALHAGNWARESDGMLVDLHHTLPEVDAEPEEVWDNLVRHTSVLPVGGSEIMTLDAGASAFLCALHAAHHGPGYPVALADLERAVQQLDRSCWDTATELARSLHAEPALGTGLRLDPDGAPIADELGLPWAPSPHMQLAWAGAPWGATVWEALVRGPGVRGRIRLAAGLLFPGPKALRLGSALARRGRLGLIAAYVVRPFFLAARARPALSAWRHAERSKRST